MKILSCIFIILFSNNSYSWTLSSSTGRGFDNNNIDIFVANDDCSAAGFSTSKYVSLIKSAVKSYWNKVPTSSLYLDVQGLRSDISINGNTHSAAFSKVPVNSILAGCNDDANNFNEAGILGSAAMTCSGDDCQAVLILNTTSTSGLQNMSDNEIEAVIAHEIGHAFGLGHSEYKFNLMYYNISGKTQKWLGGDDIDGVSYLYPHDSEFDLLGLSALGNCGSIDIDSDKGGPNKNRFIYSFLLGLFCIIGFTSLNTTRL